MALEAGVKGGRGSLLAVNTGTDRNLSTNWQLLDWATHGTNHAGSAPTCPSARFNPKDGYYYVMGGGDNVDVARSANLSLDSWQLSSLGHVEQGCVYGLEDCSPSSAVAQIAPGYYTGYWANGTDHGDRDFLSNLPSWQFSTNDVDFCSGPDDQTYFIYGMCAQTAPKNFTGKSGNFYQLGLGTGQEGDWLASYFP